MAFVPNIGVMELIILSIFLLFGVAVLVGVAFVIRALVKAPNDGAVATLAEENRRLRAEVATLKGEKP